MEWMSPDVSELVFVQNKVLLEKPYHFLSCERRNILTGDRCVIREQSGFCFTRK